MVRIFQTIFVITIASSSCMINGFSVGPKKSGRFEFHDKSEENTIEHGPPLSFSRNNFVEVEDFPSPAPINQPVDSTTAKNLQAATKLFQKYFDENDDISASFGEDEFPTTTVKDTVANQLMPIVQMPMKILRNSLKVAEMLSFGKKSPEVVMNLTQGSRNANGGHKMVNRNAKRDLDAFLLGDKYKDETSAERSHRVSRMLENIMQAVKIVGHVDSFVTTKLKSSVRKLAKLCDDDDSLTGITR